MRAILALSVTACHTLAACQPAASGGAPPPASTTVAAASAPAPSASSKPAELTPEHLMKHVEALTAKPMAGREAGSEGERLAADYVAATLTGAGLDPARQSFEVRPSVKSLNVVATIAGSGARKGEHVIAGAHIDHLGTQGAEVYHGAEDNASGVAVLLDVATALSKRRAELDRSITFVFFGAEEVGLVGSRHYAKQPTVSPMVAMVNVDMIGRDLVDQSTFAALKPLFGINGRRAIGVIGTRGRARFKDIVAAAATAEEMTAWAPEDLPEAVGKMVEDAAKGRGDNNSFEEVGVPAIFFGQGESDDYHKPSDTPEKLAPEGMAARARIILRVLVALSAADLTGLE